MSRMWSKTKKIASGNFNQLLFFLLLLFLFRPYGHGLAYTLIWKLIFASAAIAAIFNCHHSRRVKTAALVLVIPAFICNWSNLYFQNDILQLISQSLAVLFLVVCTCSILFRVIAMARVTLETLRAAICVYFLIGFAFTYFYSIVYQINPDSFHFLSFNGEVVPSNYYLSQLVYFSFVTLLTIGYGDVTPAGNFAQSVSILEGMMGQFYLAILVARLVAVYSIAFERRLHPDDKNQ